MFVCENSKNLSIIQKDNANPDGLMLSPQGIVLLRQDSCCTRWGRRLSKRIGRFYLHQQHMAKVKELLADTDKSIGEIAYELGFNYPHHLSRVFKKQEGVTPSEYRLRVRG